MNMKMEEKMVGNAGNIDDMYTALRLRGIAVASAHEADFRSLVRILLLGQPSLPSLKCRHLVPDLSKRD